MVRAKQTKYIPVVLTRMEVNAVIDNLEFPYDMIVSTLYGCGLRLSECLSLRLNALDFDEGLVIVRDGKGKKDRSVPMPQKLRPELKKQVKCVVAQYKRDLKTPNFGGVFMPETLGKQGETRGEGAGLAVAVSSEDFDLGSGRGLLLSLPQLCAAVRSLAARYSVSSGDH